MRGICAETRCLTIRKRFRMTVYGDVKLSTNHKNRFLNVFRVGIRLVNTARFKLDNECLEAAYRIKRKQRVRALTRSPP